MPLSALHCKRVSSVLRPKYRHLSPVLGLISANSPFLLGNLESFPSTPKPTVLLIRDLFANKGDRWAITQSRSKASFYLDSPQRLAHVLGMALTGKEAEVDSVLGGLGIGTNRVDGARTGVSLQKYRDVVANLAQAVTLSPEAVPIYMQLVWQRAKNKRDIWCFYKTLEQHYLPDLLLPLLPEQEFVQDNFTPQDFSPKVLTRAGLELANLDSLASPEFANSLDLVAANLSTSTWKPVWKLMKHDLPGNNQSVYDCVEVVVREFVDMLLFDEAANAFVGLGQELAGFYEAMPQQSEEQNSKAWFALCQNLPQCDYIQPNQHELFPSLENVLKCAAHLLGLPHTNQALAFCQAFNAQTGKALQIEERREMFRPALSDESQRREIALCRLGSLCIELTLVRSHRLATAKHSRVGGSEWVVASRPKHLEAWSKSTNAPPAVLASCFWPAFLQDQMLEVSDDSRLAQQLTSAPWGADRERNWSLDQSFLGSELTLQEQAAKRRANQRVLFQALRKAIHANQPEAVAWLVTKAGVKDANGIQLACTLWKNQAYEHAAVRAVGDLLPKQARDLLWGEAPLMDRAHFALRNLVYY
ncbi:hypothetical protein BASA81_002993 [Batrachochytrium salamandrivorans]|nr:hypothetical protein BASA81_002993 [Batrachochytrium salamandrivorans]